MAIYQAMCTSFKVNVLKGVENFNTGTPYVYKIALYTSTANLNENTTTYSGTTHEVANGNGYTTGGNVLTVNQVPTSSGTTAFISFASVTWPAASFTSAGALIYNATTGNAVAVLNFGANKTTDGGAFTIDFPPADANSAIIRVE